MKKAQNLTEIGLLIGFIAVLTIVTLGGFLNKAKNLVNLSKTTKNTATNEFTVQRVETIGTCTSTGPKKPQMPIPVQP